MDTLAIVTALAYLVASVCFILGLKMMSSPRTAVRGNMVGAVGMLIAVLVTLLDRGIIDWWVIIAGLLVGSALGVVLAVRVKMTSMPQMVAALNGLGGGASVCVAAAAHMEELARGESIASSEIVAVAASGLIGAVTFWGSLVAYAKLEEWKSVRDPKALPGQMAINGVLLLACVALGAYLLVHPDAMWAYWALVAISSILGFTLVLPIGGADMPVVVALLNSYSGLAGAATGFILNNTALIISGALVGASGIILCQIMCKAMNRSLTNVLLGTFAGGTGPSADDVYGGKVKGASADEIAMLFDGAQRVLIVPGYGMAVAQAQHAVRDLMKIAAKKGAEVDFAIHPVAGRMPGHMNVLLAEADVPYERLKEPDEINASIDQVDVVVVIGANDVVNPLARTDPSSPIAGMPIIDVDRARNVVVIKRSLSPGFAGIPNPLFAAPNTLMYFGDGQKAVLDLVNAIKNA
ncbi:MAG: NAD(P)(+) transhydrogenase (Re/Si-specific) subunit beta [Phycisphaerae bacterium]|nr:NAD(P)(+) transhydrogenase (Re/Si-specific) subunit beta [Phycisphaerae bacterium]